MSTKTVACPTLPRSAKATAYQPSSWLDTDTMSPVFGIQALVDGKWHHLGIGGQAALYLTAEKRDRDLEVLRRELRRGQDAGQIGPMLENPEGGDFVH